MLQEERVNPVSQSSLDRFNESSDTKATLVTEPNDGYRDALQIAIDTPQRPDVFFNWGGGSIRSYVRAGLLEDLTPHLDGDPAFKSAFLPSVLDAGKIDDAYYGIPMHTMQPKLMFYNTAVLDDVGVSIPTTWQEDIAAGTGQGWRHPAIAEAVNMIRDLVERGAFGTNYASVQYEAGGAETLLEQGQAAISPGARSR